MKSKSGWDGKLRLHHDGGDDDDTSNNDSNSVSSTEVDHGARETEQPQIEEERTKNDNIDKSNEDDATTQGTTPRAVLTNPEALTDPTYTDPNAPPAEQIEADEDLLADEESDVEDIDLVHSRVASIPALHLERFKNLERLGLRQNEIQQIAFPDNIAEKLTELDLYDNRIGHLRGLDKMTNLTSLDLSFNNIKHIKNVSHLHKLKDIYFVQNLIRRIEGLEGLKELRNLELAANKIREIENLDELQALEELWLGRNKITEIKVSSNLSICCYVSKIIELMLTSSARIYHLSRTSRFSQCHLTA